MTFEISRVGFNLIIQLKLRINSRERPTTDDQQKKSYTYSFMHHQFANEHSIHSPEYARAHHSWTPIREVNASLHPKCSTSSPNENSTKSNCRNACAHTNTRPARFRPPRRPLSGGASRCGGVGWAPNKPYQNKRVETLRESHG